MQRHQPMMRIAQMVSARGVLIALLLTLSTYLPAQSAPAINFISPSAIAMGSAGFSLIVVGANFDVGTVVRWNGLGRPTTVINSAILIATISATDVAALETVTITVFNPLDGGTSNATTFTIYRALALKTKDLIYDRFS